LQPHVLLLLQHGTNDGVVHTGQYEALQVPASGKTTEAPPVPVRPPLELEPPVDVVPPLELEPPVDVVPPLELEPPVEVLAPPLELEPPAGSTTDPPPVLAPPVEVLVPPLELEPPVEVLAPPAPVEVLAPPVPPLELAPPAPASSVLELLELEKSPPLHDRAAKANQGAYFMSETPCRSVRSVAFARGLQPTRARRAARAGP